ncbi:MAG: NAD(P)-dependent oxidoreductase [Gammaproteobacteria bacterium]|nr:NAD(P)-dependent oxidoreductase [Gammaproteobacteria bacterium]
MQKVTVLGLGAMGAGMAANLQTAGLLHAAWNRGAARAEQFMADTGFSCASSVVDAVSGANVVLSCVSADSDVLQLVDAAAPALTAGCVWVDSSTISAETARKVAAYLSSLGVLFLDAPVSGGKEGAENGALAIMCGGEAAAYNAVLSVFEAIGARWQLMGPVGAGQATKAVNQIMAAGMNQAVTEAMAFAQSQGLPIEKVIDVVGSGAAGNWFVNHRGQSMTDGCFTPGFRVALHHKDLKICQDMAEASGVPTRVVEETLADYQQLMEQGFGDEDISALYRLKRR